MMQRLSRLSNLATRTLGSLTLLASLAGCSMMETDLSDCPTGLYVSFRYDYNTQRADMFPDQVGGVSVYVFDQNDRFVMRKDAANTPASQPLRAKDFAVHFDEAELPAGTYRLLALAQQKDYAETLATPGAKMRRSELRPGDPMDQLTLTLDRAATDTDGRAAVEHEGLPLDTLWATRNLDDHFVTLVKGCPTRDTLSLIRDTKQLNITLRQTEDPADMHHEDYTVRVYDTNGRLLYNNALDPTDTPLTYSPYARWTSELPYSDPDDASKADVQRAAHYELFLNRLIYAQAARLVITYDSTGETVADINLPAYLADGRAAYEQYNYSPQEYLDREYQYNLDFFLVGHKWAYVNIRVAVLNWAIRRQNVDLQ